VHQYLLLLALLLLLPDTNPTISKFELTCRSAHTLQAHFLESYSENGKLLRTETGVAYFRKPGKMRWEYEYPEKNLFLVDGKSSWFYTPADHTATKIPARQSDDWRTPLALLAGEGKLSKVCGRILRAALPASDEPNFAAITGTGFECVLKNSTDSPEPAAQMGTQPRIFLEISDRGELIRVRIQSAGSVLTEFRFKDWEVNPPLEEALFRFSPPPGVVIVDGLLPTAPSVRQ
jgi:outer membrane lipoprotein carrier protein